MNKRASNTLYEKKIYLCYRAEWNRYLFETEKRGWVPEEKEKMLGMLGLAALVERNWKLEYRKGRRSGGYLTTSMAVPQLRTKRHKEVFFDTPENPYPTMNEGCSYNNSREIKVSSSIYII